MTSYLAFGITYAFAAGVQPGPLQTYLISQTLKKGWRLAMPAAGAPLISDGPILVLGLFLLSTIPANFIFLLRICGGLFLLYLGYRAFKSWQEFDATAAFSHESSQQTLLNAVYINLLNPAPYLGWSLVLGPLFLEGWRKAPINGIALLVSFYLTLILTQASIIIVFGFARKLGPKVNKILVGLSSVALFLFGMYQLWVGFMYFNSIQ